MPVPRPLRSSMLASGPPLWLMLGLLPVTGCQLLPRTQAQPVATAEAEAPVAVETAVAKTGSAEAEMVYTGTTQPAQQVSLRSQVSGQLQRLRVDVGDPVAPGELLAEIDDGLLRVAVNEAEAEFTSRQSEVARAEAEVSDVTTALEAAKVRFRQAQTDASRLQQLAAAGAIPEQEAEQAQLTLDVAQQSLRSVEEQIRTRQQAVNAAKGRVNSQRAVVDQTLEQLSFTTIDAPIGGVVLQKPLEVGDYVQPGTEILQIGDLSAIEVVVQVSELDLPRVNVGQAVQVRLDAFPEQPFAGRVTRISPVADATSRLLPVEVTLDNPDGRIGSGLMARVRFANPGGEQLVIPPEALHEVADGYQVFVLADEADSKIVQARPVIIGQRSGSRVEILSGLSAGDVFVVRSDRPLTDGQAVRTSILSETGGG